MGLPHFLKELTVSGHPGHLQMLTLRFLRDTSPLLSLMYESVLNKEMLLLFLFICFVATPYYDRGLLLAS